MVQARTGEPIRQVRIDTWKSIARYLGRSSRTVQRWHREYGLPVYRLGVDSGSIFAFADELDSWLRNRNQSPNSTLIEMPRPAPLRGANLEAESDRCDGAFDLPRLPASRTANSAALVAFAHKLWKILSNENLKLVARSFREALDLDPGNAEAFAGLSHALIAEGLMGNLRTPDAYISARAALERAIEIDSELPEVMCAAASLKMVLERDWQGSRRQFQDCLVLCPANIRALVGRALLHIAEGSPREASCLLREAVLYNALNAPAAALHCWSVYLAKDFSEALNLVEEARASGQSGPVLDAVEALAAIHCEKPGVHIPRIQALVADSLRSDLTLGALGYAFAVNGKPQRANEVLATITHSATGGRGANPYAIALVLMGLNEKHDAGQWLEQSYRSGSLWSLGFPCDPILESLRDEPSYRVFLSKVSYPLPGRRSPMSVGSRAALADALKVSGA